VTILIRTDDVPPRHRYEAWLSMVADTLGPLDVRIDPDTPLRGEIEAGQLGPVTVGRVETSTPHSVHRTPGLIRRDSPPLYRVALAMSGSPLLEQNDRIARLRRGEFAIYDFTQPYDLAYDSGVHLAVFSFPREMLGLPEDLVAAMTAVPIAAQGGSGALVAPLLHRLTLELDSYPPASATRLSSVMMDLITTAVAERAGRGGVAPPESRERMLLMRIHAFIEQHLGDADLSPDKVAAAHFVSVRYLYRLFETQNTTVAAWIRHRRLERCRRDLADPAFADVPVSSVAARWGLVESAHFSRLFRRTYGLPPAEYRRVCQAPPVLLHPAKNSSNSGMIASGATLWTCPATTRCTAPPIAPATAWPALTIHPGLLPPVSTRVGWVIVASNPAGSSLPGPMTAAS